MKPIAFPELEQLTTSMDETVAQRHIASISSALATTPRPRHAPFAGWRRWVASVAVAGTALVPAAAVASDNALPGDALYGIKVGLEPIVRLFDPDVVAEHRVEEAETLDARGGAAATIDRLIHDARAALAEVESPELSDRLDAVVARRETSDRLPGSDAGQDVEPPVTDQPATGEPSDESTTTTEHRDQPGDVDTTTTAPADRPRGDATTTTTTEATRSDEPPVTTRPATDGNDATTTTSAPPTDGGGDRP